MNKIAVYGKGGIGKSTIISHLSAAYAIEGKKVLQVGCDPKSDSVKLLVGGRKIPTILDCFRKTGNNQLIKREDIIFSGFGGVQCCESGGPEPGEGCAGRGVIKAFEILNKLIDMESFDIVNFDVLGDVVCGGFAMPIHLGYANRVLIVLSGEAMALYAANNIMKAIRRFAEKSNVRLVGVILNCRNIKQEENTVRKFCDYTKSNLLGVIPRSEKIIECDYMNRVVNEVFPDSIEAIRFSEIIRSLEKVEPTIPELIDDEEFNSLIKSFSIS